MPIAVDPTRKTEYVFPENKGEERPPRFFLKTPDLKTYDRAQAAILAAQEGEKLPDSFFSDLLRGTLTGWEDWFGAQGAAVPFDLGVDGCPTDECLMRLSYADRMELAFQALSLARQTPKESE